VERVNGSGNPTCDKQSTRSAFDDAGRRGGRRRPILTAWRKVRGRR
jgi:hypothetical protein